MGKDLLPGAESGLEVGSGQAHPMQILHLTCFLANPGVPPSSLEDPSSPLVFLQFFSLVCIYLQSG